MKPTDQLQLQFASTHIRRTPADTQWCYGPDSCKNLWMTFKQNEDKFLVLEQSHQLFYDAYHGPCPQL